MPTNEWPINLALHAGGALGHSRPCWYFYRLSNDARINEFCVANASDPNQYVDSIAPDGTTQRWAKRTEGDLVVFTPPDGYVQGAVGWMYDRRLQIGQPAPREVLEREALRNQVSVNF